MKKYVLLRNHSGVLGLIKHIMCIFSVFGIMVLNSAILQVKSSLGK